MKGPREKKGILKKKKNIYVRKQIALRIITIRCVWGSDFFVLQSDKQLLDMV
jgi:hypothetical protein